MHCMAVIVTWARGRTGLPRSIGRGELSKTSVDEGFGSKFGSYVRRVAHAEKVANFTYAERYRFLNVFIPQISSSLLLCLAWLVHGLTPTCHSTRNKMQGNHGDRRKKANRGS